MADWGSYLQKGEQALDKEVEAVPGAGVEPTPSNSVDAADDGDNRPLGDDPGNVACRTRETTHMAEQEEQKEPEEPEELEQHVNAPPEDVVGGTQENPVRRNSDERLPMPTTPSKRPALGDPSTTMRADRDGHEQAMHNTREEAGSHNSNHQPLDGTWEDPVASSPDNQFLGDTHDENGNGNRDNKSHDGTCGQPVAMEGDGTFEGTRQETPGKGCEEADDSGTLVQDISETGRDLVPGEHDASSGNGTHEATITGAPRDFSSHCEHELCSEPQPSPSRHRGRPRFVRCPSLEKWCNKAVAGREVDNRRER
ncbi:hypothetical protein KVR01_012518 [Diaporthe batatas]|uniref:uncharacterized protein n=1 Tax=Diaporthe batatas TaxID=748121 RepID=UPI001D057447|nr:uncharacterized protein KVR01_012518 [Diaporthe batatas]KAG8157476.1 hypothetical protein KVR01_012518 [Diaporthe batatas]